MRARARIGAFTVAMVATIGVVTTDVADAAPSVYTTSVNACFPNPRIDKSISSNEVVGLVFDTGRFSVQPQQYQVVDVTTGLVHSNGDLHLLCYPANGVYTYTLGVWPDDALRGADLVSGHRYVINVLYNSSVIATARFSAA